MRIDRLNDDYYVYLSGDDLKELTQPIRTLGHLGYKSLEEKVSSSEEKLYLSCTNDSFVVWDEKSHDEIYFDRDDLGPIVFIHTGKMLQLLKQTEFIMIRYDRENKLFLFREN